jgi:hypothetical protein
MSGSELDALAEDQAQLTVAALDHFNPETEVQDEDDDPTDDEVAAARAEESDA